jgi:hypothetical protein
MTFNNTSKSSLINFNFFNKILGSAWDLTPSPDIQVSREGDFVEFAIARSVLRNTQQLRVTGSMIQDTLNNEKTFNFSPRSNLTKDYYPIITHFDFYG